MRDLWQLLTAVCKEITTFFFSTPTITIIVIIIVIITINPIIANITLTGHLSLSAFMHHLIIVVFLPNKD